jgi:DNA-binding LacI/PurR family transcriptional regulator
VLNSSPSVSETTREKVLAIIEELNYRPSAVARQLSTGKQMLAVGIVAPFFTRPIFVERLRGMEAVLADSDYQLVLYNIETPAQLETVFDRLVQEKRVDGAVIISLPVSDEDASRFQEARLPVVLVDTEHPELISITMDHVDGGRQAAQHLVDLGHRRIAYISEEANSAFDFTSNHRRFDGFCQVLEESGIPFNPILHRRRGHGRLLPGFTLDDMIRELLLLEEAPTAIFADSDTQAVGAVELIRSVGLRVPEDVSVIGYGGIELSSFIGLTTVDQSLFKTGMDSINTLLAMLRGDSGLLSVTRPVTLTLRETTGPPGVED